MKLIRCHCTAVDIQCDRLGLPLTMPLEPTSSMHGATSGDLAAHECGENSRGAPKKRIISKKIVHYLGLHFR